jgi:hypothetical protein
LPLAIVLFGGAAGVAGLYLRVGRHAGSVPAASPSAQPVVTPHVAPSDLASPPKAPAVAPHPAAPPAPVHIQIDSVPSNARLIDASDGAVLGHTPISLARPRGAGKLAFRLETEGYEARAIAVPLDADFAQTFELEKRARSGARKSAAPVRLRMAPPPEARPRAPGASKAAPEIEWE